MKYTNRPAAAPRLSDEEFLNSLRREFGCSKDDPIWSRIVQAVSEGVNPRTATESLLRSLRVKKEDDSLQKYLDGDAVRGRPHVAVIRRRAYADLATVKKLRESIPVVNTGVGDFKIALMVLLETVGKTRIEFFRVDSQGIGRYLIRLGFTGRAHEVKVEPWDTRVGFHYRKATWEVVRYLQEITEAELIDPTRVQDDH